MNKRFKLSCYINRNDTLKRMGFSSYSDYLASDLWREIKREVLAIWKKCRCCGKDAALVHHANYQRDVLDGRNKRFLVSICDACHEHIEFEDGKKVSVKAANGRMMNLASSNGWPLGQIIFNPKKPKQPKRPPNHRYRSPQRPIDPELQRIKEAEEQRIANVKRMNANIIFGCYSKSRKATPRDIAKLKKKKKRLESMLGIRH